AGGARKWPGVQLALALGGPRPGRRRRPRPARVARHRGARIRGLRGPGRPRAGFPCPRRARAHDPPPALLQGADAVSDRAAGRDLADARLAADPPLAREDSRGDRRGRRSGPAPALRTDRGGKATPASSRHRTRSLSRPADRTLTPGLAVRYPS